MATKGQIVEQVLRIVNGGGISDDSKVTSKEVGTLLEHERDALVRKTILENSSIGEHEIPNEFLSMLTLDVLQDTSNVYGNGGRAYSQLPQTPVNLPNDGGIYRVCKVESDEALDATHSILLTANSAVAESSSDVGSSALKFTRDKVGSYSIGNKLVFSFQFSSGGAGLVSYQFAFDYFDYSSNNPSELTLSTLDPFWLVHSLMRDSEFNNFLKINNLTLEYSHSSGSSLSSIIFSSYHGKFSFGLADETNYSIKSVLTNSEVITCGGVNPLSIWSDMTADTTPVLSFGLQIDYHKNKRIYSMEADPLGIKAKDSTFLNMHVSFSQRDVINYDGLATDMIAKAWMNKFGGHIGQYGLVAEQAGAAITIKEEKPLGGFDHWAISNNTMGSNSSVGEASSIPTNAEAANYNQSYCYSRMPNPGTYSGMYDSAIALSGRKYWYRQEGRVYLYNENIFNDIRYGLTGVGSIDVKIAVWMLAKSGELKNEEEFPMPSDAIPEVIKSLVATFTAMRTATEDLTNNNIDIS